VPDRVAWAELPAGLRARIEALTGPVLHARPVGTGHNSEVALAVRAPDCTVFLKGVRDGLPRAVRFSEQSTGYLNTYLNNEALPEHAARRVTFCVQDQGQESRGQWWPGSAQLAG
jgi:hypothetical protein